MSIKQALSKMVSLMAADPKHEGRRLSIVHCNCLERAFHVKELVMKQCRFGEILISDTGGISTVYAYDGGIVVAYCATARRKFPPGGCFLPLPVLSWQK